MLIEEFYLAIMVIAYLFGIFMNFVFSDPFPPRETTIETIFCRGMAPTSLVYHMHHGTHRLINKEQQQDKLFSMRMVKNLSTRAKSVKFGREVH